MPSGSHGGSPGSHGGGSHGGGSHHSGGYGGSSHSGRTRPFRYVWFGRHYYVPIGSPFYSFCSVMFSISAFLAFILLSMCLMVSQTKDSINFIEEERNYYLQMIEKAEENSEYKVTAIITDHNRIEDREKWYFKYTFGGSNHTLYEGYTFSIYTLDELSKYYPVDSEIDLAVNSKNINSDTDSVPIDYKNYALEDDAEYINASIGIRNGTIIAICLGVVITILITTVIIRLSNSSKCTELEKGQTVNDGSISAKREPIRKCMYCGSTLPKDSNDCKNCGAKNKDLS